MEEALKYLIGGAVGSGTIWGLIRLATALFMKDEKLRADFDGNMSVFGNQKSYMGVLREDNRELREQLALARAETDRWRDKYTNYILGKHDAAR